MNSVFQQMQSEHRVINQMVTVFEAMLSRLLLNKNVPSTDWSIAINFFKDYADLYHHGKEENILFPAAHASDAVTKQGGPHCTKFFGMFINSNHLADTLKDVETFHPPIEPYTPKEIIKPILQQHSPLRIPLKEHEIGYYCIQLISAELQKLIVDKSWDKQLFIKVSSRYLDMLKVHIQKEDDCLFVLLKKNFPEALVKTLTEEFNKFNKTHEFIAVKSLETKAYLHEKYITHLSGA